MGGPRPVPPAERRSRAAPRAGAVRAGRAGGGHPLLFAGRLGPRPARPRRGVLRAARGGHRGVRARGGLDMLGGPPRVDQLQEVVLASVEGGEHHREGLAPARWQSIRGVGGKETKQTQNR